MFIFQNEQRDQAEDRYDTANLCTKIMDFRVFDSSGILILRGGIPRHIGNLPESLRQAIS